MKFSSFHRLLGGGDPTPVVGTEVGAKEHRFFFLKNRVPKEFKVAEKDRHSEGLNLFVFPFHPDSSLIPLHLPGALLK